MNRGHLLRPPFGSPTSGRHSQVCICKIVTNLFEMYLLISCKNLQLFFCSVNYKIGLHNGIKWACQTFDVLKWKLSLIYICNAPVVVNCTACDWGLNPCGISNSCRHLLCCTFTLAEYCIHYYPALSVRFVSDYGCHLQYCIHYYHAQSKLCEVTMDTPIPQSAHVFIVGLKVAQFKGLLSKFGSLQTFILGPLFS